MKKLIASEATPIMYTYIIPNSPTGGGEVKRTPKIGAEVRFRITIISSSYTIRRIPSGEYRAIRSDTYDGTSVHASNDTTVSYLVPRTSVLTTQ